MILYGFIGDVVTNLVDGCMSPITIHTHTHTCAHTHAHVYIHTYMHIYMYIYTHMCYYQMNFLYGASSRVQCNQLLNTHPHTHTYIHSHICIYIHIYIYTYTNIYIYVFTRWPSSMGLHRRCRHELSRRAQCHQLPPLHPLHFYHDSKRRRAGREYFQHMWHDLLAHGQAATLSIFVWHDSFSHRKSYFGKIG